MPSLVACRPQDGQVGVAEQVRPGTTPWCPDSRVLHHVRAVHDACRRDYNGVSHSMDRPFGSRSPEAALAELQANNGTALTILAQTLEVTAIAGQGGLV